jgi:hypothetical protein
LLAAFVYVHVHVQVYTKKRNRLEHHRLNKLVYVSYNRRMENRFVSIGEAGSKGRKSSTLCLKSFCEKMNGLRSLKKVMMFGLPLMKLWVQHKVFETTIFLGLLQLLLLLVPISSQPQIYARKVIDGTLRKVIDGTLSFF